MPESISLEETNRIRVSMGLAPVGVEAAEGQEVQIDPDQLAERNMAERRAKDAKDREEAETRERIAKAQNRLALSSKLKGSTLGAADASEPESASSWIKAAKKKSKNLAKQLELAQKREKEREAEELAAAYGEEDLAGLKVAHKSDAFEEGQDVILTLKDSRILDGEEDELHNVNLADDEALKKSRERTKKALAGYTGYDDDEFDEGRVGQKRSVLEKYDDDINREWGLAAGSGLNASEGFRLGGAVDGGKRKRAGAGQDGLEEEEVVKIEAASGVNRQLLNLDYAKNFEVSDYAEASSFKKPKKKKVKRSTRRADAEEGDVDANGDINMDGNGAVAYTRIDREVQENLVDDDDLQLALARQRRATMKKAGRRKPEDVAAEVAAVHAGNVDEEDEDAKDRVTFDDTSEFVRNVTLETLMPVKREPRARSSSATPAATAQAGPSTSIEEDVKPVIVKIERVDVDVEMEEGEAAEDDEDEELAEMALRQGLSLEEMRLKMDQELADQVKRETEEVMISKPEPIVSGGLAGALALLRQQGAIKTANPEQMERERIQKEKDLWLADHRRRVAQKELEKIKNRGVVKDQAQREWENKMREQQEAREALQAYSTYKPDVDIVYHDEFGRVMTKKEAWKSLSHKFHGKTSGRMKTELRLRRINEERKALMGQSGDTPTGMIDAFSRRQAATGEAHMVLSVGNRSTVPLGDVKGKGKAKAKPSGPKVLG